ncbi:hypothetical protein [Haloechinothrix sp. LS1_15]|uniref:hypothetical protein n=1 Tax=Haloechinothrix sp. LS1_15 TaxID=2652248 RepID=UPI002945ADD6|nr:hypothetical protein [Haloechinothrix sp. LS1_15]MDV6013855.1 hypothetical protein [Haloechinothrix sp. LS1_15]
MTGAWLYVLPILGAPLLWALGLAAGYLVRRGRRRRGRRGGPSVAAIAARVRSSQEELQPVEWPRHDPDGGVVRDERPTRIIPRVDGDHRRPPHPPR